MERAPSLSHPRCREGSSRRGGGEEPRRGQAEVGEHEAMEAGGDGAGTGGSWLLGDRAELETSPVDVRTEDTHRSRSELGSCGHKLSE